MLQKEAIFSLLDDGVTFSFCFGDSTPENDIDDLSHTDNGDMVRVLATTIQIIIDFIEINPQATVIFMGSTPARTKLYSRIVRRYYHQYSNDYNISAGLRIDNLATSEPFDPLFKGIYLWFSINKKA